MEPSAQSAAVRGKSHLHSCAALRLRDRNLEHFLLHVRCALRGGGCAIASRIRHLRDSCRRADAEFPRPPQRRGTTAAAAATAAVQRWLHVDGVGANAAVLRTPPFVPQAARPAPPRARARAQPALVGRAFGGGLGQLESRAAALLRGHELVLVSRNVRGVAEPECQ